ncbi:hypothetical protein N9H91_02275 [Pseudomonadales bacterium]|nr:hypothetical protein [Pseudomonadales bacterium]
MKKCITGLLLLAFAVPSWAEDDVWYCVEEHNYALDNAPDGIYKLVHYKDEKFTFRYEADKDRLAIVGRTWGASGEPYYLDCTICLSSQGYFGANDNTVKFRLAESRFFQTQTSNNGAAMTAGTCTKF